MYPFFCRVIEFLYTLLGRRCTVTTSRIVCIQLLLPDDLAHRDDGSFLYPVA